MSLACIERLREVRPVTSLEHQGGQRVFWEGPKFFKLCPIVLNTLCATHFSRESEEFFRKGFLPSYGPA